jgi:ribosomal protein S12 methylthiotransferase accessory factor YcaO
MSDTPDHLIPGWFTPQQWRELQPCVERLVSIPGGILLVAVTVEPTRQNYPTVAFGVFDSAERAALRRALEACRRRRTSRDVDRGDLAATETSEDDRQS